MAGLASSLTNLKRKGRLKGRRGPGAEKAKTMLRDNSAQGHPLTGKQKRFFGFIAGGGTPSKV